jgi:L-galactono-1,4-lactone dehydrogenase
MEFMERLLQGIERLGIPAPSPIEQRWTAASSSLMSPAHGAKGDLFSWVGIINYLPTDDEAQRYDITKQFKVRYCDLMRDVGVDMNAASHWAKLEQPESVWKLVDLQLLLQRRFPIDKFNSTRASLDPNNIMPSPFLNAVLGKPRSKL